MTPHVRAAVAFVAGRIASSRSSNAIFDYERGKYVQFGGSVTPESVNVFDYDRGAHFSGSGSEGRLSLFHYGDSHHVSLNVKERAFDGFDYGSSSHFSGTVSGGSVTLYDYAEGQYFQFSL